MTTEQENQMVQFREEWRKYGLSTERIDKETTKEVITSMYKLIGKEAPTFIFVPSLMFAQFQIAFCREILPKINQANLGANLRANLRDNLRANLRELKVKYEQTYFWGSMDAYWIAFYEFPEKFLGVKYKPEDSERLALMSKLAKSSSWFWAYENYCFVSDRPEEIKMNDDYQLHSVEGPAISWIDGEKIHYVNGRKISEKYFNSISNKTYTMEYFISESNEEYKSTCIALMQEKHGDEYLVNFFRQNLQEIDTFVDKKDEKYLEGTTGGMNVGVYTLFKGEINNEKIAYVRCYCPSTDRMFFLGVDIKYSNVKDAIASLYRIPSKLKTHIKSISRQGERFSTILTEE